MTQRKSFHLAGTIISSFFAMTCGMLLGGVISYCFLPKLNKIIIPQIMGYQFDLISNTMVVLAICVIANLIIVKAVFTRIPSVSISIIIFSVVAKAQRIFDLSYLRSTQPNVFDFFLFVIMAIMLISASMVYHFCKEQYKTDVLKDELDNLFKKYETLENVKESAIKIVQEIKEPELWGIFYKKQMQKVRCLLRSYSNLLINQSEREEYRKDLGNLRLELPFFIRLIVTGTLAFATVICIGCMIFEIPL